MKDSSIKIGQRSKWAVILNKTNIFINSKNILSSNYWTELRIPKLIDENVKPGDIYVIAIQIFAKEDSVEIPEIKILYTNVEKVRIKRVVDELYHEALNL